MVELRANGKFVRLGDSLGSNDLQNYLLHSSYNGFGYKESFRQVGFPITAVVLSRGVNLSLCGGLSYLGAFESRWEWPNKSNRRSAFSV